MGEGKGTTGMIKGLFIVLVMLLGAYPIIELTRLIVFYWRHIDTGFVGVGISEIILMWILYLSIIPILYWRLRK